MQAVWNSPPPSEANPVEQRMDKIESVLLKGTEKQDDYSLGLWSVNDLETTLQNQEQDQQCLARCKIKQTTPSCCFLLKIHQLPFWPFLEWTIDHTTKLATNYWCLCDHHMQDWILPWWALLNWWGMQHGLTSLPCCCVLTHLSEGRQRYCSTVFVHHDHIFLHMCCHIKQHASCFKAVNIMSFPSLGPLIASSWNMMNKT